MAMMLPRVSNAVAVTESDVNVMTPDSTAVSRKPRLRTPAPQPQSRS
jgi:hypothetical protein